MYQQAKIAPYFFIFLANIFLSSKEAGMRDLAQSPICFEGYIEWWMNLIKTQTVFYSNLPDRPL